MSEIAISLVLLVAAGLCFQGLRRSARVDPGLDPDGVLLVGMRVGMHGYTRATAPAFYRSLRERLGTLPGVTAVGLANWYPLGFEDTGTASVEIPGRPLRTGEALNFRMAIVSPGYFSALRIPLVAGRDFDERDQSGTQRVAIINETMAQALWPGQDALGRTFRSDGRESTVVGIAKSGRYRLLNDPPESFFYLPNAQAPWALDLGLCIRVESGEPVAIINAVRREIRTLDPNVDIWQSLPMAAYVGAAIMPQRIAAVLLTTLSVVALLLAALGVYAVMSYAVSQRIQEFGIRIALGATPRDLLWQVSRQGLLLALLGLGVGLGIAIGITRLLRGFLYGVSPFDPTTFIGVPLLLLAVALAASLVPARRATQVNPIDALRAE